MALKRVQIDLDPDVHREAKIKALNLKPSKSLKKYVEDLISEDVKAKVKKIKKAVRKALTSKTEIITEDK